MLCGYTEKVVIVVWLHVRQAWSSGRRSELIIAITACLFLLLFSLFGILGLVYSQMFYRLGDIWSTLSEGFTLPNRFFFTIFLLTLYSVEMQAVVGRDILSLDSRVVPFFSNHVILSSICLQLGSDLVSRARKRVDKYPGCLGIVTQLGSFPRAFSLVT